MFGIDSGEILIIAVVALVVIGPKDLPRVMRALGSFIGRARGMARHFRSGIDAMIREAEFEEMEKKWQAQNERIMREHPLLGSEPAPAKPVPGDATAGVETAGDTDWGKPMGEPPAKPPPRPVAAGSAPPIPPAGAAGPQVPPADATPPPGERR